MVKPKGSVRAENGPIRASEEAGGADFLLDRFCLISDRVVRGKFVDGRKQRDLGRAGSAWGGFRGSLLLGCCAHVLGHRQRRGYRCVWSGGTEKNSIF